MDTDPEARKRPAPRGTAAYPRKRAVAACQTCRSRKTKCDNQRPTCSFCERAGGICIYSASDLSSYDPASLAILDRLENLENNLIAHMSLGGTGLPSITTKSPETASFTSPAVVETDRVSDSHTSVVEPTSHLSTSEIPPLCNTVEHVLSWPVFGGRYDHQLDLSKILKTAAPLERPTGVNVDLEIRTCKQLGIHCFDHVLSKNPIIEREFFNKILNNVCLNGAGWDADSCLVLLVCALGSIASPEIDQTDWKAAHAYFVAAQRRIGMLMTWDGLIVSQCYFLAGVYLMYKLRPLEAWRMFAQGVICTHPGKPDTIALGHYSLEECVYWACWKSEVELRMHLQIPSVGVIGDRYPPLIPEPPSVTDASSDPSWFYYLADVSHRRLDMDVRENVAVIIARHSDKARLYLDLAYAMPTLEQQLRDWEISMPVSFDPQNSEESLLHQILGGRLLDTYDVLYIPFLEGALCKEEFDQKTTDTLNAYARKALDYCVIRIPEYNQGYNIRHHGTWLMIRTVVRSALMILSVRAAGRIDLLPHVWKETVLNAVSVLRPWKDECVDLEDRLGIICELGAEFGLDMTH
ncbi:hypothetical protein B0J11DRAFT_590340 [Dendryphion nanum]|uniref:Zn(2)-C6 fungal-type domain-containing protein n=1 Tax=Dendryphion nanum TaxID=256645 RepID=A0A9P9IJ91_9PLEO|nr:hypothetical protein B0J11DRAFT_590340 [Dendryphion nanum]